MHAPRARATPRNFQRQPLVDRCDSGGDEERQVVDVALARPSLAPHVTLEDPDEGFTTSLRRYAASLLKAQETTSQHRPAFEARAARALA